MQFFPISGIKIHPLELPDAFCPGFAYIFSFSAERIFFSSLDT